VLSPDGISSSAYGTEEILIELMPLFGLAAFTLILPMTLVILFVMLLVVLSYREVVSVYTRAGRLLRGGQGELRAADRPGRRGRAADRLRGHGGGADRGGHRGRRLRVPAAGHRPVQDPEISVGIILLMCFGNLRGIREAGRIFALPTYLFSGSVILMIVVGLIREVLGNLPQQNATRGTHLHIGTALEG
jgi:amino acid transporter